MQSIKFHNYYEILLIASVIKKNKLKERKIYHLDRMKIIRLKKCPYIIKKASSSLNINKRKKNEPLILSQMLTLPIISLSTVESKMANVNCLLSSLD